jgi:hypothetical protein
MTPILPDSHRDRYCDTKIEPIATPRLLVAVDISKGEYPINKLYKVGDYGYLPLAAIIPHECNIASLVFELPPLE